MSKSLANLRAEKAEPRRPERSLTLTLAPDLMAESQALLAEEESIIAKLAGSPKRAGQSIPPRLTEVRDRLAAVYAEMSEFDGELRLRANLTDGDWRRWCNEHPARSKDEPGYERDRRVAFGICNADDLLDNLAAFVYRWNGEPCSEDDWRELLEPNVYPGDKAAMAREIVDMYEGESADFRERRTALQGNLKRLSGFASPEPSESAMTGSMDGSLDSSTEATTETATAAP
jgi:hypothetical protein